MMVNATRRRGSLRSARDGLLAICLAVLFTGCATNPVTGRTELALVSEAQEVAIGRQQYGPGQQMQGGAYVVDPELQAYVAGVGERLAAVSDRDLPYEFVVLNSGVPNAWAMPGGKIAINRGLLTELGSEAELAAVMGHEIVHAAARHGAQAMERGMITQGALLATAVAVSTSEYSDYSNLVVGAAGLGAQLITQKYGRDAEREADRYGMTYMDRAGYDPQAAVELQETFVRLSEGRSSNWLEGLFASHPPSRERVENNRAFATELGRGGELGRERYEAALAALRRREPGYAALREGRQALAAGDHQSALRAARRAIEIEPREARFHALEADALAAADRREAALASYDRAIELEPGYFAHYQARGFANLSLDRLEAAQRDFERANGLLPTAENANALGRLALARGGSGEAREWFAQAAASNSRAGSAARSSLARIDLGERPGAVIRSGWRVDGNGELVAELRNGAPFAATGIVLELRVRGADGRVARRELPLQGRLGPGEGIALRTGVRVPLTATSEDVAVVVTTARPAD
ncbi:MAG: M48 family metalloprotease [Pseudomonadales bacterium]|jgi:predicted Zn-dependent protease|nr:M48 family metalloprotease [Pseudomonadales bacterium]